MLPPADGIVRSFVITAAYDVALNLLPPPVGAVILRPYFEKHTVLAAGLIAGFVGAVTFCLLAFALPSTLRPSWRSAILIFIVSALVGFPMQYSGIFPHLNAHYYGKIPRLQSFAADGLSGVIVACTYWLCQKYII
tara:strand:+ start:1241 stop:1648 length:408 start_codon:yes stop_codon:yes gene_type:complete